MTSHNTPRARDRSWAPRPSASFWANSRPVRLLHKWSEKISYRSFLLTSLNPTLMQTQKTKSCIPRVLPGSNKGERDRMSHAKYWWSRHPRQPRSVAGPRGGRCLLLSAVFGRVVWAASFHGRLGPELHICQSGVSRMLTCLSQN